MFDKLRDKGYFEPIGNFLEWIEPDWDKHEKNLEKFNKKMMKTGVKIDAVLGIGEFEGSTLKERRNAYKGYITELNSNAKFGDIIGVNRPMYIHYGIYISHEKVIHFSSLESDTSFADNRIIQTDLKTFLRDSDTFFVLDVESLEERILKFPTLYPVMKIPTNINLSQIRKLFSKMKINSPEETVERAKSCLGNGSYNLATNNCEHFAVWCKTGVSKSYQVDAILSLILQGPTVKIKLI
ncbi:lecithin retinol acyltransferase family protein [Planomicrobium okeanokoites]|uniref:Lecithin retinol acyltransferase family protein n=1 Tax=Planomicrobium okeanokoites TaxID=244 RepID=A0ABV7KPU4_PLAOK|nr:lecithin retinol acyltransferase family protein [Planomicrobium okeanokoites]TAA71165.1 hypothetical protein D2910_02510 [Planomicrobium okeanokoites]